MSSHSHDHAAVAPAEVLDPVCGMTISPDDAVGHLDHKGRTYYFCSQSCLDQFRANPDAFLAERPAPAATPAEMEREYTCPMDPEVRQEGPVRARNAGWRSSPLMSRRSPRLSGRARCIRRSCAMRRAHVRSAEWRSSPERSRLTRANPELEDMTRRFWWSAGITAPILAFMISEFVPGQPLQRALPHGWLNWILLALASPVVVWGGWPFFVRGWASVVNRHLNMFTLIALGVGAAYTYSVVATLAPGAVPRLLPDDGRSGGVLRARRGHRGARPARPGSGTASAEPNQLGDQEPPRTRAEDGAQD